MGIMKVHTECNSEWVLEKLTKWRHLGSPHCVAEKTARCVLTVGVSARIPVPSQAQCLYVSVKQSDRYCLVIVSQS